MANHAVRARRAACLFRPVRVWISVSLLVCASGAPGESDFEVQSDLEQVRVRLETVARELARAHDARDIHTEALARNETLAGEIRREIANVDKRLAATQQRVDVARRASAQIRAQLAERQHEFARALRASYRFARRDPIARLLDLESLRSIDRMFAYHSVVERAHQARFRGILNTVSRLERQESKIAEEAAAIAALRDEKRHRLAELEARRAIRADAIRALAEHVESRKSQIARLRVDEQRLLELVAALRASLSDNALKIRGTKTFRELRGKLPWPVSGRVLARYGSRRGATGLTWQGMLIAAPAGDTVHSIYRGRVAYADWLRGFGLLLIIEHEGGFMSLYGHNESLTREIGDWVESGEVIATVGDSGGNAQPALYFEIRDAGRPENPRRWCVAPRTAALVSR